MKGIFDWEVETRKNEGVENHHEKEYERRKIISSRYNFNKPW